MRITYRRELINLITHYRLPRVVAEIGVAEGRFTGEMLGWNLDRMYGVDNWAHIPGVAGDGNSSQEWHDKNKKQAFNALQWWEAEGKLIWLGGLSVEMARFVPDASLGLLYLDADHSYAGVMQD